MDYGFVACSLLSGIVGSVLTIGVQAIGSWVRSRRELRLLKAGVYVDATNAIDDIYGVISTYSDPYQNNEMRLDDATLSYAKTRLLNSFEDRKLLLLVSQALSAVRALNSILDHYRNECLVSSGKGSLLALPYIQQLNDAVRASFQKAVGALASVGSYCDPKHYAKRIVEIEKARKVNLSIIKALQKNLP